jgi:hypothetical protein
MFIFFAEISLFETFILHRVVISSLMSNIKSDSKFRAYNIQGISFFDINIQNSSTKLRTGILFFWLSSELNII